MGPLAHDAEIDLLLQIETYFPNGSGANALAQGMSLPTLLADMEANFPSWIRDIAEVWGTPALCDFEGIPWG